MQQIPFFNFDAMHKPLKKEMIAAFEKAYDTNWWVLGNELKAFEKAYASYTGTKFATGVSNGLDAIVLALEAVGVGEGDEVIVPSNTYIATLLAVSMRGATPILVEPDVASFNLDPNKIEVAITAKTKAVIPVHLYGLSCAMDAIEPICKNHNLVIVEDNAQSQGASCRNKTTGSWGLANATSFYPGKNLGALGEAGAVSTDDENIDAKIKMLRNYGTTKKYHNAVKGYNDRMDELQAYFLNVKLKHLDTWNQWRIKTSEQYTQALSTNVDLLLPTYDKTKYKHVFHQYVIRHERRDELQSYLLEQGVHTLIHYPIPPHLQPAYKEMGFAKGTFPIAEQMADTCLSLPIYPGITEEQVAYVCDSINSF